MVHFQHKKLATILKSDILRAAMAIQEMEQQPRRALTAKEKVTVATAILGEIMTVGSVVGAIDLLINQQLIEAVGTFTIVGWFGQALSQISYQELTDSQVPINPRKILPFTSRMLELFSQR